MNNEPDNFVLNTNIDFDNDATTNTFIDSHEIIVMYFTAKNYLFLMNVKSRPNMISALSPQRSTKAGVNLHRSGIINFLPTTNTSGRCNGISTSSNTRTSPVQSPTSPTQTQSGPGPVYITILVNSAPPPSSTYIWQPASGMAKKTFLLHLKCTIITNQSQWKRWIRWWTGRWKNWWQQWWREVADETQ